MRGALKHSQQHRKLPQSREAKRLATFLGACPEVLCRTASDASDGWLSATDDDQLHLERHLNEAKSIDSRQEQPVCGSPSPCFELVSFFSEARTVLRRMRQDFICNNREALHEAAAHVECAAARVGARGVCVKARALATQALSNIRHVHIDALEQQLDASEAIFCSCGLRV